VCDEAVEMAMKFARGHKRAGRKVIDHQLVQLKLNEMHALTEALRSYVMRVAWERDGGGPVSAHAGLVMNLSTDIIQRVTRLNMDVHGADGCMMYARVDKLQRDAMVWTHLAGDTVQRLRVVKRLGSGGGSAGAH
jgi:alkylation response protein AidB-like acyl-CoA dehydrogenase